MTDLEIARTVLRQAVAQKLRLSSLRLIGEAERERMRHEAAALQRVIADIDRQVGQEELGGKQEP